MAFVYICVIILKDYHDNGWFAKCCLINNDHIISSVFALFLIEYQMSWLIIKIKFQMDNWTHVFFILKNKLGNCYYFSEAEAWVKILATRNQMTTKWSLSKVARPLYPPLGDHIVTPITLLRHRAPWPLPRTVQWPSAAPTSFLEIRLGDSLGQRGDSWWSGIFRFVGILFFSI